MDRPPLLVAILAAVACTPREAGEACFAVEPEVTSCPAADAVDRATAFSPGRCDVDVVAVEGAGERVDLVLDAPEPVPACCYDGTLEVTSPGCVVGRPYRDGDGVVRVAGVGTVDDPVAAAWVRAAAGEHASVAAFARLALQLMAHGAPLDLVADVQAAGLDEVRHAEACLAVARRHGAVVAFGPFPFADAIDPRAPLATLATDAVREGCLAETIAAQVAAVAAGLTAEVEVAAVLRPIAADEARHAVLSWRVVAWARRVGGAEVREAVRAAFAGPPPSIDVDELAVRTGVSAAALRDAAVTAAREIVVPAARAVA